MKKFSQVLSVFVAMLVFASVSFAQGRDSSSSNSASHETVLDLIEEYGRENTVFSVFGTYYNEGAEGFDGMITINQKGDLFTQTVRLDDEGNLIYGLQEKIGNVFEKRHPDGKYVVLGIYSIDLNGDGLHDLVVRVANTSAIPHCGAEIATTKDFFFATEKGRFAPGKSEVRF